MEKGLKNESYLKGLSGLKERMALSTEQVPLQKIVMPGSKKQEVQLMLWIDKTLMKTIKRQALEEEITIKEMVTKAVENYLAGQVGSNE